MSQFSQSCDRGFKVGQRGDQICVLALFEFSEQPDSFSIRFAIGSMLIPLARFAYNPTARCFPAPTPLLTTILIELPFLIHETLFSFP